MTWKNCLLSAGLCAAMTAWNVSAFELNADTKIVIPENSPDSTPFAAEEMAAYLGKTTGITPAIVKGKSDAPSKIVIGTLKTLTDLPSDGAEKLKNAKSPDAYIWLCKGDTLIIAGKDRVGELYGTYGFLTDKVGVRWFRTPTKEDSYEYIPKIEKLKFEDFLELRDPEFLFRHLSHCGATGKCPANGQTLAVRQGFQIGRPWNFWKGFEEPFYRARIANQGSIFGGHCTFVDGVPQKLFDEHPEYFAMQDGKRVKGEQYCLSNPGMQQVMTDYILDLYKKYPAEQTNVLFGMIDVTHGWCECEECHKLDETEKFDGVNVSTRFHKVVTKIMKDIYDKYPNANLMSWAYHTYRSIPKNVTYDPRAIIYYCDHGRCYGHEFSDPGCARNAEHRELIKEWQKICKHIWVYEYSTCTPLEYCPVVHRQAKDLRYYRQIGIDGWKEEMLFADAEFWPPAKPGVVDHRADGANCNWQWFYVTGKLLWDPNLNEDELLADIESKYYGKAYPAMKKYHACRRELWDNSSYCMGYPTRDQRRPQLLFVPGSKEKLLGYLDEADKLAKGDAILERRLAEDRDWLTRYWIQPNEEMASKISNTLNAPTRISEIKIDGDPSDPEWNRAFHTSEFKFSHAGKGNPLPPNMQTTLSILSDDDNLYFRVLATCSDPKKITSKVTEKDGPVWGDECMEFFIMPPSAAQEYYHVSVNTLGTVYDSRCPGNDTKVDLGVEAAVKITDTGYVMEVKVPLAKIGKAERGALWRLHAARNCASEKVENGHFGKLIALDGCEHHDTSGYRGIIIGSPILYNGGFEDLNEKGEVKHWTLNGAQVMKISGTNAVKIGSYGNIQQFLYCNPGLFQSKEAKHVRVSVRASGQGGKLSICFLRYTDTYAPKSEHGYSRKMHPTETAGSFKLTPQQKVLSAEYTVKPDEWVGLMLCYEGKDKTFAIVDDVSLMLDKK